MIKHDHKVINSKNSHKHSNNEISSGGISDAKSIPGRNSNNAAI